MNEKQLSAMNEAELRDAHVPWFESAQDLAEYINCLVQRDHDYGTCVYAMSMAATAAFRHVAAKLGVTGFQASCADMDILRRIRNMKHGFRVINYADLLFPQYCNDQHFPNWMSLIESNKQSLADAARAKLSDEACESVRKHWEWLASLAPPKQTETEL